MNFAERYGPWAIVTGASSGIGEQFARVLAERGLHVLITARRVERLEVLAAELRSQHNVQVQVLPLDLAGPDFLESLLAAAAGKDVGLVISNAGFGVKGLHHLQDRGQLDAMLNVNSRAPMLIAQAFAPRLIERGRGGLLLTGSVEGFVSFPWSAAYAASKAYALSLGEALRVELKADGVDVLVLMPSSTDTEAPLLQGIEPAHMLGLMSPREVAEQALAQLGKRASFVPGLMNRWLMTFLCLLPRSWSTVLAGKGIKDALDKSAQTRAAR